MKRIFYLSLFLVFSATALISCKKEHIGDNSTKDLALDVTVSAGTAYHLDLSAYGDADDLAQITTQAARYTTSEINSTVAPGIYTFFKSGNPKAGGNGDEVVVLKVYEQQQRGRCNNKETNITIHFTVL